MLNFAARFSSIAVHRQLSDMGTPFMFRLLAYGHTTPDNPGRYVSVLFQLPSLACRAMGLSPAVILRVYEAVLVWHPVLSLVACFAILRARRRLDLLAFPVLSFAIADQISHAYACGTIHDAISFFWPPFLLILTTERPKIADVLATFSLLAALTFTHESAAIFFLLIAASSFQLSRKSRGVRSFHLAVAGYSFMAAIYCVLRVWLYSRPEGAVPFFFLAPEPLSAVAVLVSLLIASALWQARRVKAEDPRLATLIGVAVLAPLLYFAGRSVPWIGPARASRMLSVGLAFGFGVLAYVHRPREHIRWAVLVAASFLAVASVHDIKVTLAWARGVSFIDRTMRDSPGCRVLAHGEYAHQLGVNGIADLSLPRLSFLLQENLHPRSVLFPSKFTGMNPCRELTDGGEIDGRRLDQVLDRFTQSIGAQ
jgi:hypothetical protein